MSSDDGWILRNNKAGQYVLQHYSASADQLPNVEAPGSLRFGSLEEAVLEYQDRDNCDYPSEYGLRIDISRRGKMELQKFVRKPFDVEGVRVTADNMADVANWCQGSVETSEDRGDFIKVNVSNPLNERQTRAYVGDWVLFAGRGYKVYTNGALRSNFDPDETEKTTNVFDTADSNS